MNFLAHAYLSFGIKPIIIGNLISDFVKGKKQFDYPEAIQTGITLHRSIDSFTDQHPSTKKAATLLKPTAGRYAPVFIDIIYDHFLATDPTEFPENKLKEFTESIYAVLSENEMHLPLKFRNMLPYMIKENWLENYRLIPNIEKSINSIFRRAKYLEYQPSVFNSFLDKYDIFKQHYNSFFPDLKNYALNELNKTDKNIFVNFSF